MISARCPSRAAASRSSGGEAEDHTGSPIDSLSGGELDFAFVGLGPPGGRPRRPRRAPVVAAMRNDHPVAGRRSVTMASLRDHAMAGIGVALVPRSAAKAARHLALLEVTRRS